MFSNIAGITSAKVTTNKNEVSQLETLLDLAKNRIGQREGLQQWINKNVLNMPTICTGRYITIIREYDEIQQNLNDTLWIIALLSIQQQGYTSKALLSAVTATSLNKSTGQAYTAEMFKDSSVFILNELVKLEMVESKIVDFDTERGKRKQTLFYIAQAWSKANLNEIIEDMRENTSIVCKPLYVQPADWKEGQTTQEGTRLKLTSRKADTLTKSFVGQGALDALNKLQAVSFEVSQGHEGNIFNCLDNETDELKRDSFTELLELQGKKFFFPVTTDYRIRMYTRGGTVHPQAQKEVRQFLNFSEGETVNRLDAIADLTTALLDRENPVQRKELVRLEALTAEYVTCKVIVNFDGVANGLQHQSVMLRSIALASKTMLIAGYTGKEVYRATAEAIKKAGIKCTRKQIKKIIMVASYGATKTTQIERLNEFLKRDDAIKAYQIINNEIPELKAYTNFITSRCKRFKTLDCKLNTPDGIELSFRKIDRTKSTLYAGSFSAIVGTTYNEDPKATARATAPNLIHLTDSYHLRLIVMAWNGNISTIHDSVGVTAGRGKELKKIILSTFKEVHSNDWLNEWAVLNNVTKIGKRGELKQTDINNLDMFC